MTSIATHPDNPNLMLSSSRDKTVLVWNLTGGEDYGYVSLRVMTSDCMLRGPMGLFIVRRVAIEINQTNKTID